MAHGDAREGKWRGNWRMERVASTLHTTSKHDVSSITTADVHISAASSRLNWPPPPPRFKWTCPFRWKTKSGFCTCAITFKTQSNTERLLTGKKKDRKCLLCFRQISCFSPTSADNILMYKTESKVKLSLLINYFMHSKFILASDVGPAPLRTCLSFCSRSMTTFQVNNITNRCNNNYMYVSWIKSIWTCFGHHMPIIRRTRTKLVKTSCEDAWLCWLWLCGAMV
jgi:hypothetical protein